MSWASPLSPGTPVCHDDNTRLFIWATQARFAKPASLTGVTKSLSTGPLAEFMNESIKQCKYPSRWKMGQVTPLFKKNDESSEENYRPVTVLPTLNNVFEKLLASQLDQFYSEILSDYISAYRRHCSCETSLMRLTEDWRCSLDNKQIVAVISMDLSKAFDTIPHGLLLPKLKAYGVNSRSCSFLKITYTVGRSGWK